MTKYLQILKSCVVGLVAITLMYGSVSAQQGFSLTSLYRQNLYNLNPASTGRDGCFEINLQHKQQWMGTMGKPTYYQLQLLKGIGETSGIGLNLNYWKAGLIVNNTFGLTYAKHLALGNKATLSLGVNANLLLQQFQGSNAVYFDPGDVTLSANNSSSMGALFDFAALLNVGRFDIGLTVPRVYGTAINHDGTGVFDHERELRAHVGHNFNLSDNVAFEPMVVYRQLHGTDPVMDLYGRFQVNSIGLGVGYRTNESILLTFDLVRNEQYRFAYGFDYSNSNKTIRAASHELMLSLLMCKEKFPYSVNIQQVDSSYQTNEFKNMEEVAAFQQQKATEDEWLGKRIQKEMDNNPGAMAYNIPLPEPIKLNVGKQKYKFSTFKEMDSYLDKLRVGSPELSDRLVDAQDDDNPIILRSLRNRYQFRTLNEARSFMDSLKVSDPRLAAQIESYMEDDQPLILNVPEKSMEFRSLEEMKDYQRTLNDSDPILAGKLKMAIDENPDATELTIKTDDDMVETVELVEYSNGQTEWVVNEIPKEQAYNYTVNIIDTNMVKDPNYFYDMTGVRAYEDAVRDTNEELAVKIQGVISDNPGANIFDVYKGHEIILRLHGQKYKFRTLKELDAYILKMEQDDPDLAVRLKNAMDDDTDIIVNTSKQKYHFRTLRTMSEYGKKLSSEDPVLFDEFNKSVEDDNLLLVKVPGKRYKFKNLDAMNEYLIELEKSNPALVDKIRNLVDEDPTALQYDVNLAKKVDVDINEETGEVVVEVKEVDENDVLGYIINIVDTTDEKDYNFFPEFDQIDPYVKAVNDTNARLATRIKGEISDNPDARVFNVSRHEEIVLRLHGQKYKFRTLKEMDEYIMSLEQEDPDLAYRLKKSLEDPTELMVPTSKKNFKFRTLKGMTDYAWQLQQSDPELSAEFNKSMMDNNLLIVEVKGQKFKFRTLKEMEDYLITLKDNNPGLEAKIRTLMDEEPTALRYDVKLGKKIEMTEKNGEYFFTVTEVPVEQLYDNEYRLYNYIVYFNLNKTKVDIPSMPTVNDVIKLMKENPDLKIRLEGHSCDLGADKVKKVYSEQRAKNVKRYMVLQGIKSRRIQTEGKADSQPASRGTTEKARDLNRRVQFVQVK